MKIDKSRGDFIQCYDAAVMFQKAAELCMDDANDEFFFGCIYSFSVNAAFACELYLKAIMIFGSDDNEFSTGHHLKDLFEDLRQEEQEIIKLKFSKTMNCEFDKMLETNTDVFEKWRYAFEGKEAKVEPYGLLDFMHVLREYVDELKKTNN